jgi:hypothetical protein
VEFSTECPPVLKPFNPEVLCFYFNEEQGFKQCSGYTEIRIAELNVGASLTDDFNCQFWINLNNHFWFDAAMSWQIKTSDGAARMPPG